MGRNLKNRDGGKIADQGLRKQGFLHNQKNFLQTKIKKVLQKLKF